MQTRLKGAESERFSNPLVYALAGLCAALVFAVAAMWRRYSLREAAWWATPQPDGATTSVQPRQSVSGAELSVLPVEVSEAPASESLFPAILEKMGYSLQRAKTNIGLGRITNRGAAQSPQTELAAR